MQTQRRHETEGLYSLLIVEQAGFQFLTVQDLVSGRRPQHGNWLPAKQAAVSKRKIKVVVSHGFFSKPCLNMAVYHFDILYLLGEIL